MKKGYLRLVGLLLFVCILLVKVDIREVPGMILRANISAVLLAAFLTGLLFFLKALRWNSLLAMQGLAYPAWDAFRIYLSSVYVGSATPGRLGEFVKVWYLMNDKKIQVGRSVSSVLGDRLLDVVFLALWSLGASIAFTTVTNSVLWLLVAIVCGGCLAPLLWRCVGDRVMRLLYSTLAQKYQGVAMGLDDFVKGVREFNRVEIAVPIAWTLLSYLFSFIQWYLIALSLRISVSFLYLAFAVSVASLLTLLPLSIAGIGTREATLISLLSPIGVDSQTAVSYSILYFAVSYGISGLMGAMAWWVKPVPLSVLRDEERTVSHDNGTGKPGGRKEDYGANSAA